MNRVREFINEEDGIGVVEIILILVILIGLVVIFKGQIEALVKKIFTSITTSTDAFL